MRAWRNFSRKRLASSACDVRFNAIEAPGIARVRFGAFTGHTPCLSSRRTELEQGSGLVLLAPNCRHSAEFVRFSGNVTEASVLARL